MDKSPMKLNTDCARGATQFALGTVEQRLGRLFGNPRLQCKGFQRQTVGRARIALAAAHRALQSCIMKSVEAAEQAEAAGLFAERDSRQTIRDHKQGTS